MAASINLVGAVMRKAHAGALRPHDAYANASDKMQMHVPVDPP